jgi:hypothetical protein
MERKLDGTHILAVAAGLAVGGLAGYLLGRKAAARGLEWRIASEVEGVREHYRARIDALSAAAANAARKGDNPHQAETSALGDEESRGGDVPGAGSGSDAEDGDSGVLPRGIAGFVPDTVGPGDLGRRDPLEGFPGTGTQDDDHSDEDGHDSEQDVPDTGDGKTRRSPYVISLEDFTDQCETFSKITISYFADDDVLVDERDNPIEDPMAVAGSEFKTQFASNSSTGGPGTYVVYVRNRRLETDFEIALNEGSYAEAVGYGRPG